MHNPVDFLMVPGELMKLKPKNIMVAFMAAVQYHDVLMAYNSQEPDDDGTVTTDNDLNLAFMVFHDALAVALEMPELQGVYEELGNVQGTGKVQG